MPPPPPTKFGPVGNVQRLTAPPGPSGHAPPPTKFGPIPTPQAKSAPIKPVHLALQRMEAKTKTREEYESSLGKFLSKVQARLTLANNAIAYTRGKLSYGAANITAQVEQSKGMSYLAATEASTYASIIRSKISNVFIDQQALSKPSLKSFGYSPTIANIGDINDAAARAIATRKFGAGVCDDFASVAFFYLKQHNTDSGTDIYRLSLKVSEDSFHAAVILADPGLSAEQLQQSASAVVVDAWPAKAFAVRVIDWKYKNAGFTIKFKGSDLSTTRYLQDVRQVWKAPYLYDGEESYRRFGDDLAEDNSKTYDVYFKNKAAAFRTSPPQYSGQTWGKEWTDETAL